jgi:hypothetical protein|tara:strand:- start:507 stop:659 length:153 start_codon:yes stop_codon:yes gene_type:complete
MMKKQIKFNIKSVEDLHKQMNEWVDANLPIEEINNTNLAATMLKSIGIKV